MTAAGRPGDEQRLRRFFRAGDEARAADLKRTRARPDPWGLGALRVTLGAAERADADVNPPS